MRVQEWPFCNKEKCNNYYILFFLPFSALSVLGFISPSVRKKREPLVEKGGCGLDSLIDIQTLKIVQSII